MRNQCDASIGKSKFILSERNAFDVRELEDYVLRLNGKSTMRINTGIACLRISDSLKYAYKEISIIHIIKKLNYLRAMKIKWLMKNLSQSEIIQLNEKIDELEGVEKKKMPQKDNQLEEEKQQS